MKYKLTSMVTVSAYCEVEADSKEDALKIAEELPVQLSFNGCGYEATDAWLIEEGDGMPQEIKVEDSGE